MFGIARIFRGLNLPPEIAQVVGRLAAPSDQRQAFNAVLLATVAHASNKPNFNLELEINDLWIRLGNLRQERGIPAATLGGALGSPTLTGLLGKMLDELTKGSKGILQNMR